jgi:Mor family transcriptional regulator
VPNEKIERLEDAIRAMRRVYHDAIAKEIETTSRTYADIAKKWGVSEQTAYTVARERGLRRNSQQPDNQPDDPPTT